MVVNDSFKQMASAESEIHQGFLSRIPERTVRVRIKDNRGFITIKGKGAGAAHPEFEYEVPLDDAVQMLSLCEPPIIKKVDVFHDDLQGLVIAELEVPSEDYQFALPPFVGLEVTGDKRYYNSQLGVSN